MGRALIRRLTPDDLENALALSSTAGWNQRLADWRMLLSIAPSGGFAAVADSRIVGTSMGIDYGGFGWIAMMLVDPDWRGRGFGSRLLEAAIDALPREQPIRLDATPMGRPLYRAYGFEDEAPLSRHVAEGSSRTAYAVQHASEATAELTPPDLPGIATEDRQVFGGDRQAVLEWALGGAPHYARIVTRSTGMNQYCLGRQGRLFDQIGPVVADSDDGARALVSAALQAAGSRKIAIDAYDVNGRFTAWLRECGFQVERPLFRMRRPGTGREMERPATNTDGLREFAIFGPEFG